MNKEEFLNYIIDFAINTEWEDLKRKERLSHKDELTVVLNFLNSVESEFYDENGSLPEDYYDSDIVVNYEDIE